MSTIAITGGRILRPDGTIERNDVLVNAETGLVEAVGTDLGADETLDAAGSLVMPGLINAHCHVAMTLLRGYADDKPLDAWLQEDIWPVEAALEPADVRAGAKLGIAEMIASGTTAFVDMYFHMEEVAAAVEAAGIRARLGHGIISVGKDDEAARADLETGVEFATEYDGAGDGRITTALMPHSLTTVDETHLRVAAERARERDLPAHIHANETMDEVEPIVREAGRRPLAYARDLGLLESADFIAHGVHVDAEEIDLLAETGAGVAHCPASNMKLASGMAPVQELLDAGVRVGIGTDGPASNNDLDMFDEIRDAAMLGKLAANDASALDAATVVRMATGAGGAVAGLPAGRIEAGGTADLIVVDLDRPRLTPLHDPVSHLAYAASGADVRHSVIDGSVVMRDRTLTTMDVDSVMAEARDRARALIDRAESC